MESKTLITVEEYLRMSFDGPEPDYVDGELKERHLGSKPHGRAQVRLAACFEALRKSCSVQAYTEITLRISATHYRVADLAAFVGDETGEGNYPTRPPEFVVEIVSEDDRYLDIKSKFAEYHAWGVKYIWLVDPWTKELSFYDSAGLHDVPAFESPEFGVKITAAEIFED